MEEQLATFMSQLAELGFKAFEQAPILVDEILLWSFLTSLSTFLLFTILTTLFACAAVKYNSMWRRTETELKTNEQTCKDLHYKRYNAPEPDLSITTLKIDNANRTRNRSKQACSDFINAQWIFVVITIINFYVITMNTTWIQILVAPRLFMLEYVKNMVL